LVSSANRQQLTFPPEAFQVSFQVSVNKPKKRGGQEMKKVLAMLLCLTMIVSVVMLAACQSDTKETTAAPAETTKAPESEETTKAPDGEETTAPAGDSYTIATCVKLIGIGWFDRMDTGIKEFADETGHETFLVGPPQADAALQNQILEDLISQGVDAISVVPFSPEACEPVLKKAMEAGIVVISHEADNLVNVDFDIEAFDNYAYGAELMKLLAEAMNYEGKYATTVGSVTSKSQNQWEEGGVTYQEENYPDMELVERKLETYDEQKNSEEIMTQLLTKYPDLKGFQGATSQDAPGAAQAVEKLGLTGKVFVVGTSMPSIASKQMENGSLTAMGLWDPGIAGKAMDKLAVMCLDGQRDQIVEGLDLGYEGYDNLVYNQEKTEDKEKYLYGSAWIFITEAADMANYPGL
jgi:simple sugar transport system substrate-binding protein